MNVFKGLKFRHTVAITTVACCLAVSATPALSQAAGSPSVTVNSAVLQELGSPRTVPGLLRGRTFVPQPQANTSLTLPPAGTQDSDGPQFPIIRNGRLVLPQDTVDLNTPPQASAPALRAPKTTSKPRRPVKPTNPVVPKPEMKKPEPEMAAKPAPQVTPKPDPVPVPPPAPVAAAPSIPALPPTGVPAAPAIPSAPSIDAKLPPAPAPPPPPAAEPSKPAVSSPPQQIAALPKTSPPAAASGNTFRLDFPAGGAKLSNASTASLDVVAARLKAEAGLRVQLMAYAADDGKSSSQARRLSLSRALAVRSHLIAQGIKSTRIDVRALGGKNDGGPADRVDVIINQR